MRLKRLIYVLLLNILVSAITTFAILNLREQSPKAESAATVIVTVLVTVPVPVTNANVPPIETTLTNTGSELLPEVTETLVPLQPYIVQEGDRLSKIALSYGVSTEDILRANDMTDPNKIFVGQRLLIPIAPLPTETPVLPPTETPTITPLPSTTPTPTVTPTPDTSPARLVIDSVQGVGIQDSEKVLIIHSGGGAEGLGGWRLETSAGKAYIFPMLRLFPGASVTIHSGKGTDSVNDLYWGSDATVWHHGDTVTLRDAAGVIRTTFVIP